MQIYNVFCKKFQIIFFYLIKMLYICCYKYIKLKLYNMKGIINNHENIFCIEFDETQYTEDGLDYQGNDTVEIHPDDIIKFNITDNNIGDEVKFKKQWVVSEGDEFYYVRIVS